MTITLHLSAAQAAALSRCIAAHTEDLGSLGLDDAERAELQQLESIADQLPDDDAPADPPELYVMVQGNPLDGFDFTGPFADFDGATQAGDSTRNDWWITRLTRPQD